MPSDGMSTVWKMQSLTCCQNLTSKEKKARIQVRFSPTFLAWKSYLGVWIGDNKICAMGINAEREITSHGLAINCNTDMKWFGNIVPCGIADKGTFSLVLGKLRNSV